MLQQSIDEVFDKYVQKVDQSYGQMIKDNKILKILVYPSMVFLHAIMVTDKSNDDKHNLETFSGSFLISSRPSAGLLPALRSECSGWCRVTSLGDICIWQGWT